MGLKLEDIRPCDIMRFLTNVIGHSNGAAKSHTMFSNAFSNMLEIMPLILEYLGYRCVLDFLKSSA